MDYSKAMRIARALADMSQRELATRIEVDASLISMLESGLRKPSLDTLQKVADALGLPFHLFALLGAEPKETKSLGRNDIQQLAESLANLLLRGKEDDRTAAGRTNRKAQHPERKSPRVRPKASPKRAG